MASNALLTKLNAARERLTRARALVKDNPRGEAWAELAAAQADLCDFEREVALADGLECAQPCETIPPWGAGTTPLVLRSSARGVLVWPARGDADPKRVVALDDTLPDLDVSGRAVVLRFENARASRSLLSGVPHPLTGAGLAPQRAHTVINSRWIKVVRQQYAEQPKHDPKAWDAVVHYVLPFSGETFECVADGVKVELRTGALADVARALLPEVL